MSKFVLKRMFYTSINYLNYYSKILTIKIIYFWYFGELTASGRFFIGKEPDA